uniref:BTB domain-containing protein n=1 Tax=Panagrolaimus davidi TaxID=227884 RepID=A0A914Q5X3_9BILA
MARLNNERFETFKSQDQENGYFDLKFEIEGKIIFAHKFMLAPISDVLKRMISDIWNKKETIEITTNSYNDFYEFLKFLYSGNCKLNDENIFSMVDLSEFYQVKELQQKCDECLSQKEYTKENILVFFEILSKYSLPLFEKAISKSMKEKGINLVESVGFPETSKSTVEKIVRLEDRFVSEEKLFEKICEWAVTQVKNKQSESDEEDSYDAKTTEDGVTAKKEKETQTFVFNMNDAIKSELTEILPFIRFKKMNLGFLVDFVVKITNSNGKSISSMPSLIGTDIVESIKTLKNWPSDCSSPPQLTFWKERKIKIPSIPSQIKKRDGIEWYLFCCNGLIGVIHHSYNPTAYLLAEMTPKTSGFEITENCKIEIE